MVDQEASRSSEDALRDMLAAGVRVVAKKTASRVNIPCNPGSPVDDRSSSSSPPPPSQPRTRCLKSSIVLDSEDDQMTDHDGNSAKQIRPSSKIPSASRSQISKISAKPQKNKAALLKTMPAFTKRSGSEHVRNDFNDLPTERNIKQKLREHIRIYERDHMNKLAKCFEHTRGSAQRRPDARPHGASDPFSSLQPLQPAIKEAKVECKVLSSTGTILRTNKVSVRSYRSSIEPAPPFTYYTTMDATLLAKNDTELRSYPELKDQDASEKLHKELAPYYEKRLPEDHTRHLRSFTKLRHMIPYLQRLFSEVDISANDILQYLLQYDLKFEPGMPQSIAACFEDRSPFCSRTMNQDQFSLTTRISQLPQTSTRRLTVAYLCCKAIKDMCNIRLWPSIEEVILGKQASISEHMKDPEDEANGGIDQASVDGIQGDRQSDRSGEHQKEVQWKGWEVSDMLQCAICFVYNCPSHGENQEISDDSESGDVSEPQPKDPYDGCSNHRTRVTQDVTKYARRTKFPGRSFINVKRLQCGINDRGEVVEDPKLADMDEAYPGAQVCASRECFWLISARNAGSAGDWTLAEEDQLGLFLTGLVTDKRGPCIAALAMQGKSCVEVYQKSLAIAAEGKLNLDYSSPMSSKRKRPSNRKFTIPNPSSLQNSANASERGVFYPCNHQGSCEDEQCLCFESGVHCEKSCLCDGDCERRFPGCKCKKSDGVCSSSERCFCVEWNRECDPDLCGKCGSAKVLDPMNDNRPYITRGRCSNVSMQRRRRKRTLIGLSDVVPNGYGLFAGQHIKKDELIGEYTGEILSGGEGARRGEPYHASRNYLFNLDKDRDVDGNHISNKTRLMNHAGNPKFQNCYAKYKLVNSVTRIGLYAKRDIRPAEELLYDYGYTEFIHLEHFREKDGTKSYDYVNKKAKAAKMRGGTPAATALKRKVDKIEAAAEQVDEDFDCASQADVSDVESSDESAAPVRRSERSLKKRKTLGEYMQLRRSGA